MREVVLSVKYADKLEHIEDIVSEIIKDGLDELCRLNRIELPEVKVLKNSETCGLQK